MSVNPDVIERTVRTLQARLPGLLAGYGFGSRVQGTEGPDSDLDMAVRVAGHAGELADIAGCAVDLLDLRAASTVMQYQVVTQGERWWAQDAQAAMFESAILSEKTALDTARAGLLADIRERGTVYGG